MTNGVWKILSEREMLHVAKRLRVTLQHVGLPDGREVEDYLRLALPPFVVILAQTEDGHLICERQYKHGPRRVILTLPAGGIEDGEEPLAAAKRELLEETGHVSDDWAPLMQGVTQANSEGSRIYAFLARNCRKIAEPNSGDLEDMVIEMLTAEQLLAAAAGGDMPVVTDAAALLPGLRALDILKP